MIHSPSAELSIFEERYSEAGLFRRYARGRIRNFWNRQLFVAMAAFSLSLVVTPVFAFVALPVIAVTDALDCIFLRRLLRLYPSGPISHSASREMELMAGLSSFCVSVAVMLAIASFLTPDVVIVMIALSAGGVLNALLTYSYAPRIAVLRAGGVVCGMIVLLIYLFEIAGFGTTAVVLNTGASVMALFLVVVAACDLHRGFVRRVKWQRNMLRRGVELEAAHRSLKTQTELATRLSKATQSVNDLILIADADGRIEFVNDAFVRMTGWREEDLTGETCRDFFADVAPALRLEISRAINQHEMLRTELCLKDGDGDMRWFEAEIAPLVDRDRLTGHINVMRDVTDKKQKERELEAARLEAEESLRVKGNFLAMMSHEIRTPLHGILATTDLLERTGIDETQRTYIETLKCSGSALLDIINMVLDVTALERGRMVLARDPFDPAACLREVVGLMRALAEQKGIDLVLTLDDGLPAGMLGDAGRLRQILLNLVGNALKFTQEGQIRVRARRKGEEMILSVEDTGIGISPDRLEKIFDSFAQEDEDRGRRFGGTGLGLSISLQLIQRMGGDIRVESRLTEGSTFTVTLPIAEAELPAAETAVAEPAAGAFEGIRMLVAEDNKTNRFLLERLLKGTDIELHFATDGFEAVELARTLSPQLILMDVSMPGMDGCEATRTIRCGERADRPRVPIIALTANAFESDRQACLEAGMDDILHKPIDRKTLLAAIANIGMNRAAA
ncbi:ATP-binding protein [Palleronia sp. LCG004]|uniref:ATP-binding protein n=1 Tax=Palleronia sp. LCG004 TaxID=3079304 RepID=UPI002941F4A8|nr:ATP-binding protein [Palleronia sp. LCG004]WOI56299.1 ATP-binding protein [Palleronia sp. LCG004]